MFDPSATRPRVTTEVNMAPDDRGTALADDVFRGLRRTPKELPPKWFYDERGSELFTEITRLPEYYLTRTERSILAAHAGDIAAATGARTLVELGSGNSEKTRLLLDAMTEAGTLEMFVPFDVSEEILRASAEAIAIEYPGLGVHAIVGDFEHHLAAIPGGQATLVAFLGSSIGNLYADERQRFYGELRAALAPGDWLLLGADLVKDPARIEAAYNDSAGVSASFNLNVLHVLNNEMGADFPVDDFSHVARYDRTNERMEMLVRAGRDVEVHIPSLELDVRFAAGEEMRTEISTKFRPEGIARELEMAGFTGAGLFTDPAGDFALILTRVAG